MTVSPWLFVSVALGAVIFLQYRCNDEGTSAADARKADLMQRLNESDSARKSDRDNYHTVASLLKQEYVKELDSLKKATGHFETTGKKILDKNDDYKAAVVKKDTTGQLDACAIMSVDLDVAKQQYAEMKRLKDSTDAANEDLQAFKDAHINVVEADQDTSSADTHELGQVYDQKKKEDAKAYKQKGLWGWLVALGEAVILYFKLK